MKTLKNFSVPKTMSSDFDRDGYIVVDNVLSPEECAHYIAEAKVLSDKKGTKYAPMINPDRENPVFRALLRHPLVVQIIEALLGTKINGLQSLYYFKPPGSFGRDLHQDNHYIQAEHGSVIGAWIPLEDSDKDNGGLLVYVGSQKEAILPVTEDTERIKTNVGDFKNDRGVSCVVPQGYQKKYLSVPAGSAVFVHGNTVHGSEENMSKTRFRNAFASHYIKKGFTFVSGSHAKREAIDVYS